MWMPKNACFTLSILYNCTYFNRDYANCMHFSHWYTNNIWQWLYRNLLAHRDRYCSALFCKATHHNHFLHVQALGYCIPVPGPLCHHRRTLSRKWPLTSWTSLHGLHSVYNWNKYIGKRDENGSATGVSICTVSVCTVKAYLNDELPL